MRGTVLAALVGALALGWPVLAQEALSPGVGPSPTHRVEDQRAAKKLSRECIVDLVVESCTALGRTLELGVGIDQNFEAASELYVMTCENGDPEGCLHLAGLAENGLGVARDPARAQALLKLACDGGLAAACERRSGASAN